MRLAQKKQRARVCGIPFLMFPMYMDSALPGWVRRSLKKPAAAEQKSPVQPSQGLRQVYNVSVPEPRWATAK